MAVSYKESFHSAMSSYNLQLKVKCGSTDYGSWTWVLPSLQSTMEMHPAQWKIQWMVPKKIWMKQIKWTGKPKAQFQWWEISSLQLENMGNYYMKYPKSRDTHKNYGSKISLTLILPKTAKEKELGHSLFSRVAHDKESWYSWPDKSHQIISSNMPRFN